MRSRDEQTAEQQGPRRMRARDEGCDEFAARTFPFGDRIADQSPSRVRVAERDVDDGLRLVALQRRRSRNEPRDEPEPDKK